MENQEPQATNVGNMEQLLARWGARFVIRRTRTRFVKVSRKFWPRTKQGNFSFNLDFFRRSTFWRWDPRTFINNNDCRSSEGDEFLELWLVFHLHYTILFLNLDFCGWFTSNFWWAISRFFPILETVVIKKEGSINLCLPLICFGVLALWPSEIWRQL